MLIKSLRADWHPGTGSVRGRGGEERRLREGLGSLRSRITHVNAHRAAEDERGSGEKPVRPVADCVSLHDGLSNLSVSGIFCRLVDQISVCIIVHRLNW